MINFVPWDNGGTGIFKSLFVMALTKYWSRDTCEICFKAARVVGKEWEATDKILILVGSSYNFSALGFAIS